MFPVWGHQWETSQVAVFLRFYGLLYPVRGNKPISHVFDSSFFLKTRLSSETLEHLIVFLVISEAKSMAQKPTKNYTPTNANLG